MIKSYFKIAWRNAVANPVHSLISLCSLVLGITIFFLTIVWVREERKYDSNIPDASRVFRIETSTIMQNGATDLMQTVGWPVGKKLVTAYPEIESLSYIRDWVPVINVKGEHFYEDALYADENFFSVLGFSLEQGNPATALAAPYSLVISPATANKYFGTENALGKILLVNDSIPYKITGILKTTSTPSHLRFDILGSLVTYLNANAEETKDEFATGWFNINMYNYVKLKKNVSATAFETKMKDLVLREGKEQVESTGFKSLLSLRPVSEIYLYSNMRTAKGPIGNYRMVRLFFLIGLFILLIACLNFVNLTTAKSVDRSREIGVKKVLGGSRKTLLVQFLAETGLLCLLATLFSTVLVVILLPLFNQFTEKAFTVHELLSVENISLWLLIMALLIPVAGFYPSWVLSSFTPITVLKGRFSHSVSGNLLRKGLVVFQFVISAAFIMSTLIVWKQMRFMQNQSLGFDKDRILLVDANKIPWVYRHNNAAVFKNALLGKQGIQSVTACQAVPGRYGWSGQFAYPEGKPKDAGIIVEYIPVDADYIKTLGLQIKSGRDFVAGNQLDAEQNFVINESAVQVFGWENAARAIGKKLSTSGKEGTVVGVMKDYHQHGLKDKINPVVLGIAHFVNVFAIHYSGVATAQLSKEVEVAWNEVYKGYPLQQRFMDEDFQRQYKKEKNLQNLFSVAAMLSIVIACMGLFGLAIYTVQKRKKEIGIRKVLGAGIAGIVLLVSGDFIRLVAIAVILAVPVAWYGMNEWLRDFAYRVNIGWIVFVLAALIALTITIVTISFNAIRAALRNPVNSLRSE